MTVLSGIFAECERVLKLHTGRMVFTFHHWDSSAWAELTIALKSAGCRLMNAYVVYSEHPISVHIRNLNSIQHDSILNFALDDNRPSVPWLPIERIDLDDSETFCRQCNVTLGRILCRLSFKPTPRRVQEDWFRGYVISLRDVICRNNPYKFGMNTYDSIKQAITQLMNKGIVYESWDTKCYWVIQ